MSVSLVRILMPLGTASNPPSFAPVLAFDLGEDRYRVLGRQPGCELWRWPPDSIVACRNTNDGAVAVAHVRH
ncbi:hypothetical protein ASC70_15510 [Caulobacter sp. Root343]|nr:hypothetical protein ASC62_15410 [Caulobacter sp. Root342]KQV67196.1 hypothetical protein ASC70_15510 [Caulobacter sp. Root343]